MQSTMNFVTVDSGEFGRHTFAFPASIEHSAMAAVANYLRHGEGRDWKRVKCSLVQAGNVGPGEYSLKNLFLGKEMKYIVTDSKEAGKQMFIFQKNINHDRMRDVLSDVEEAIQGAPADNFYRKAVSAGFTDGKTCYGMSETLRLKSDPGDTALLQYMMSSSS